MQISATIKMTRMKIIGNAKCWLDCWTTGMLMHCWWECKLTQHYSGKQFDSIKKSQYIHSLGPRNCALGMFIRNENSCTLKDINRMLIHSRTIFNSQNKTTKFPAIAEWIVVYSHYGNVNLYNNKNEWATRRYVNITNMTLSERSYTLEVQKQKN